MKCCPEDSHGFLQQMQLTYNFAIILTSPYKMFSLKIQLVFIPSQIFLYISTITFTLHSMQLCNFRSWYNTNPFIGSSFIFQYTLIFSKNSILFQNMNVYQHQWKSLQLDPILHQPDIINIFTTIFSEIYFNIILQSTPSYNEGTPVYRFYMHFLLLNPDCCGLFMWSQ
jgi:hypothetical protein